MNLNRQRRGSTSHTASKCEREAGCGAAGLHLSITKAQVPFRLNRFARGAFNMRDGSI